MYAPLTGSEQVMVVATLSVATDTTMLLPAVTAAVVVMVIDVLAPAPVPRFCTKVISAEAGAAGPSSAPSRGRAARAPVPGAPVAAALSPHPPSRDPSTRSHRPRGDAPPS